VAASSGLTVPLYILETEPSGLLVAALTLGQHALMTMGPMRAAHFAPRPAAQETGLPDLPVVAALRELTEAVAALLRAAQRAGRA
jgi:hypothetical protein